jgi:hypothetical protein
MRFKGQRGNSFKAHRRRAAQPLRTTTSFRRASFEPLESRSMLTTLSLMVQDFFPYEFYGAGATTGELTRFGGDTSEPLTVTLTSSDETELTVPESVTFAADETTVFFPVDTVDDTLLDGEQLVYITATAGFDSTAMGLLVQDYETATFTLDQSALTPGGTLTGTITVSVTGNSQPVSVPLASTRPDEIASIVVEVPVGQQTVDFSIPVTSDDFIEGPHAVKIEVPYDSAFFGNSEYVSVADPGVNTLQPVNDGHARDTDQDGVIFEELQLTWHQFTTQAAHSNFGESRGILEFDVSSIPAGAILQSAVLTLDVTGQSGTTPLDVDIFAYSGNGSVEVSDATQTTSAIGQLTTTPLIEGLKSVPVVLDVSLLQSLVGSGDFVGFTTKVAPAFENTGRFVSIFSREFFREYSRPSLHLVWAESGGPVLTANSLTIDEGATVVVTSADLAATDSDSDEAALVFTVSNVTRGQFLVSGAPATTFTQAQVAAGAVTFMHDDSELAPYYEVAVSDGAIGFGPQAAAVTFNNVNDNWPAIVPGQVFEIGERAPLYTTFGPVIANDADLPGDPFEFEIIAGNDDGIFGIDDDGFLWILDDTQLDYETTSQYVLTIGVFDPSNYGLEEITINILDAPEIVPLLSIDNTNVFEVDSQEGSPATFGHIVRQGGDLSIPLEVLLTSSDETKLTVPASIYFQAYETEASFPIYVIDDTAFGTEVVTVTASAVDGEATSVDVTVHDVESVMIDFDDPTGSPGDTLHATISVTTTNRTEPLTVWFDSTRPDEIAPMQVVIDPSQQSVVVPVPVMADATPEGLHRVRVEVNAEGYNTYENPLWFSNNNSAWLELFDPGVTTIFPVDDSTATDANQDGIFEQLSEHSFAILSHATSVSGLSGEARGILEFDMAAVPAGANIESAVLTVDVGWAGDYPEVNDVVVDVFAYQGNGNVESSDANEIDNSVGQLHVETDGSHVQGSFAIPLDAADLQALLDSGNYVGLVTKVQESLLQYSSKEISTISMRPALHLMLTYPPVLTASALTLNEGETVTLNATNLAASDADSDSGSLAFTVSSVAGGQFLVNGSPATSFTQAQVASGVVAFAHDGGEAAPAFAVAVSDGTLSDGPHAATVNFTNVNDNPPVITASELTLNEGQTITLSTANLAASDADSASGSLVFTVSSVAGGQFLVNGSPATSFTQAQVASGVVAFAHDGGEAAPAFAVAVSDGTLSDGPHAATINFTNVNDNPPVITASALTLNEGETITLSASNLAAADVDSDGGSLVFAVSNVSGGQFLVNGSPATNFTQAQVASGVVAFAHNGGEAAPAFEVAVSDGTLSDGPHAASIIFTNVNDNAPVIPAGQVFSVSEHAANGTILGFVTASDADLPGDPLSATIIAGNDGGIFALQTVGTLSVADNANLDFESASSHELTIRLSDGVHVIEQVVTVDVLDVPETKFYVVDDGTANRTFEYTAAGTTMENYTLNTGNTAPRGAASTVAGDRVWVVDANRKVYVYDASGALLGSWTAGSMSSSATPHGIATDGTDVWIVDDKSNKVFRYAGAASRLSGSQSAASSFNLGSGNGTPRDLVTDGNSLWVVNDSTTNKVFKYTIGGSLLGSWTIDSANSTPTGITIDPVNVSDIWIVDSGTDRVYQYAAAAGRTSGSQSASASFALAAGNSNPQGIADPPFANHETSPAAASLNRTTAEVEPDVSVHVRRPNAAPAKMRIEMLRRDEAFASIASQRVAEALRAAPRHDGGDSVDKYWNSASLDESEQAVLDFSLQTNLVQHRIARVVAELVS